VVGSAVQGTITKRAHDQWQCVVQPLNVFPLLMMSARPFHDVVVRCTFLRVRRR
jgi:hypothetical protein